MTINPTPESGLDGRQITSGETEVRISRSKAQTLVARAITETRDECKSSAFDCAWRAIRKLEARGIGDDIKIAEGLATRIKESPHYTR